LEAKNAYTAAQQRYLFAKERQTDAGQVTKNGASGCSVVMSDGGLSKRFPGAVAHALHSITLQDIQHYFNPRATENNNIPMVNLNLRADPAILLHAPDVPRDQLFKSMGMSVVDQVLSNMDKEDYDIKEYSALEKIVHSLHMHEVWANIQTHYQILKKNPPSDARFCPCVTDIDSNGVLKMLRFIALKVREPELMYGKHDVINNGTVSWDGNLYKYRFEEHDLMAQLPDETQVIPKLRDESSWAAWKSLMENMVKTDDKEVAAFIYCALAI